MPNFADRIKDTTTSTGTGAIVLANSAPTGFHTFAYGFGSSPISNVAYCIDDGAGNWEIGKGTFNGTTGFTRDLVRDSSNAGALVSFGAGTKTVFCTPSAEHINNANIGLIYAAARCSALP